MRKIIFTFLITMFAFSTPVIGAAIPLASENNPYESYYEGYILLDVHRNGEAYYIFQGRKYYLGRPRDAFRIMRELSLGISEENFLSGFRQVNDVVQIFRVVNIKLYPHVSGRIVLRPHAQGESYYVTPGLENSFGYSAEYLGSPFDAFSIMTINGIGTPSWIIDGFLDGEIE